MVEYEILGYYGKRHGWERLVTEISREEAESRLKEYDENEKEYAHKIITVKSEA